MEKRAGYETARLQMSRLSLATAESREAALKQLIRVSAIALECDRVGVWMFENDQRLVARVQYRLHDDEYGSGDVLSRGPYPIYWAAMQQRRTIVADDAHTHAATSELSASYLTPLGIGAMLDAPIYRGGRVVGVVCHEHIGPAKRS